MQKHFFESLYKIFLILKLAPIIAQKSLLKGKTKLNIPSTFRVLLGKPVQLENICRNTIFWLLILFSERTIFTKPSWKNSNYIVLKLSVPVLVVPML